MTLSLPSAGCSLGGRAGQPSPVMGVGSLQVKQHCPGPSHHSSRGQPSSGHGVKEHSTSPFWKSQGTRTSESPRGGQQAAIAPLTGTDLQGAGAEGRANPSLGAEARLGQDPRAAPATATASSISSLGSYKSFLLSLQSTLTCSQRTFPCANRMASHHPLKTFGSSAKSKSAAWLAKSFMTESEAETVTPTHRPLP